MRNRAWIPIMLLFVASACDWRDFDELSQTATVQVIDSPESYSGSIFGQVVAPLYEGAYKAPGLYVVGGSGVGPFALVDFRTDSIESLALPVELSEAVSVRTMVGLPGTADTLRFAASSLSSIYLFSITEGELGFTVTLERSLERTEPDFGRNILLLGGTFAEDHGESLIYASRSALFLDAQDATQLTTIDLAGFTLTSTDNDLFNVPFMGRFSHGGTEWVAVGGSEDQGGTARWSVLFIDLEDPLNRVTVSGTASLPGSEVHTIQLIDLDGDGFDDMLVGVGEQIYIFPNSGGAGTIPFDAAPAHVLYSEGRNIGQILTFGDLSGNNLPEIIAADPSFEISGNEKAGEVCIFSTNFIGTTMERVSPAVTLRPEAAEKKFGSSLLTVPTVQFPGRDELIVGGINSSYLFYITGIEGDNSIGDDPRD